MWSGSLGRPRGCLGSLSLSPALSVALSPDGDQVAVGYRADGIRIYKISSGTKGERMGCLRFWKETPSFTSVFLSCFLSFSRFSGGSVSSTRCGSDGAGLAKHRGVGERCRRWIPAGLGPPEELL